MDQQSTAPADRAVLLVRSGGDAALPGWQAAFHEIVPELQVLGWNDPSVDPAHVRYVLVWEPDPGRLAGYPNLQVIFSSAAGVDHIVRDPHWPRHVPIVRMGADEMAQTVGEYVCLAALTILRDVPRFTAAQREACWDRFEAARTARDTRIGILGYGGIGQAAAAMLGGIGFPVHGWARHPKPSAGIRCFAGMAELDAFLACTDILIGILPDTPETRGLLDASRLAILPRGAALVNVGRGTLVALSDVIGALDAGHLSLAMLDVFETEPLPSSDPAWHHPRLVVTPHLAGFASPRARARWVADGIARHHAGAPLSNQYDPARGY